MSTFQQMRDEHRNNLSQEFDLNDPMSLFKMIHDQAMDDGYINELMSILKDLVTLPSNSTIDAKKRTI